MPHIYSTFTQHTFVTHQPYIQMGLPFLGVVLFIIAISKFSQEHFLLH